MGQPVKVEVCDRHLFFGCAQKHSEFFGATKFNKNFDGSENKQVNYLLSKILKGFWSMSRNYIS